MGGQYLKYSTRLHLLRSCVPAWIRGLTDPHLKRVVLLESSALSHLVGTKSLATTGRVGEEMYCLLEILY
jgi:hypothetical protein